MTAEFDFRTTATYGCNTGFGLSGGDTVSTCGGPTGQWSGIAPSCECKCKAISNGVLQSSIEEQILFKKKKTSPKGPNSCNDTINM